MPEEKPLHPDDRRLFTMLARQLERHHREVQSDVRNGILAFPVSEVESGASLLFSNLKQGGFATFVVTGRQNWDPHNYYFEGVRQAARRGRKITRAFLLPHKQYREDEGLQLHWHLDSEAGITVKILYVGELLSGLVLPPASSLDFGIWDGEVVCWVIAQEVGGSKGPSQWRISGRSEDVEFAEALKNELLSKSEELPPPGKKLDILNLEEPMFKTAPLMDMLSTALCKGDYMSREDCSWYHGVWQYLRIFDMVSTPTWHSKFYIDELTRLMQQYEKPYVLISGTADYSVLAHVLWTSGKVKNKPNIVVLDLCQTPLIICQWYAKQLGENIEAVRDDIFNHSAENWYDCIVTDAFLTRFTDTERGLLLDQWASLLKIGGYLITTVRIGGVNLKGPVIAKPQQVDLFKKRAFAEAVARQAFLPITPSEMASKAQRYAERMISRPIPSVEGLLNELSQRHCEIKRADVVTVRGEMSPSSYLEIVARKLK